MHTAILEKSGLFRTIFPACALVEMSRTFWLYLISFETVCFILSTLWLPISGLSINYCRHLRILTYCTKWNISIFRFNQFISPQFPEKCRKLPLKSFCSPLYSLWINMRQQICAVPGTEPWFPPGSFARIWWFFLRIFKPRSLNFVQEWGRIFVANHNKFRIAQKNAKTIDNTHPYVIPFQWGKANHFARYRRELQRTAAEKRNS